MALPVPADLLPLEYADSRSGPFCDLATSAVAPSDLASLEYVSSDGIFLSQSAASGAADVTQGLSDNLAAWQEAFAAELLLPAAGQLAVADSFTLDDAFTRDLAVADATLLLADSFTLSD